MKDLSSVQSVQADDLLQELAHGDVTVTTLSFSVKGILCKTCRRRTPLNFPGVGHVEATEKCTIARTSLLYRRITLRRPPSGSAPWLVCRVLRPACLEAELSYQIRNPFNVHNPE